MATATAEQIALAPICSDQSFPLATFKRMTGLNDWALKTARRKGLKVRTVGNRRYVLGADWHAYLAAAE